SARAADHGDAPGVAHDQAADIADVYFFLDPNDNDKVVLIATFHGFIVPSEAVNFAVFDPVMRYQFQVENTGNGKPDKFINVTFGKREANLGPHPNEALQIPQPQTVKVKITGIPGSFTGTAANPSLSGT